MRPTEPPGSRIPRSSSASSPLPTSRRTASRGVLQIAAAAQHIAAAEGRREGFQALSGERDAPLHEQAVGVAADGGAGQRQHQWEFGQPLQVAEGRGEQGGRDAPPASSTRCTGARRSGPDVRAIGHPPDHQVQLADLQLRQQVGAGAGGDADHQRTVAPVQAPDHLGTTRLSTVDSTPTRTSRPAPRGRAGCSLRRAGPARRAGIAQEGHPCLGQLGAGLAPFEQPRAEDFLQFLRVLEIAGRDTATASAAWRSCAGGRLRGSRRGGGT